MAITFACDPLPAENTWRETKQPDNNDLAIREKGYHIWGRPLVGPALWQKGRGPVLQESVVLELEHLIDRTAKRRRLGA